ncbi:hypothetical protein EVAR_22777_1 [Eumeta japonica]|uniref:Uncharacterized protein n=1 Tax=Eumeta variegata TaxID=151549 RepID=A0A4C1UUB7_EUMVA|nr:hypothetical protein EVAR_22777_1 [Eumeta japonica]
MNNLKDKRGSSQLILSRVCVSGPQPAYCPRSPIKLLELTSPDLFVALFAKRALSLFTLSHRCWLLSPHRQPSPTCTKSAWRAQDRDFNYFARINKLVHAKFSRASDDIKKEGYWENIIGTKFLTTGLEEIGILLRDRTEKNVVVKPHCRRQTAGARRPRARDRAPCYANSSELCADRGPPRFMKKEKSCFTRNKAFASRFVYLVCLNVLEMKAAIRLSGTSATIALCADISRHRTTNLGPTSAHCTPAPAPVSAAYL